MSVERHPGSITGLSDDQLGIVAVSLVIGELEWSPDVAPATLDRISRDAVAYPEQFDRRRVPTPSRQGSPPPSERSAKRTVGRLVIFALIFAVVIGFVAVAVTASVTTADLDQPLPDLQDAVSAPPEHGLGPALHPPSADSGRFVVARSAAPVSIGAIDGTLVSFGVDEQGELYAVDQGGRILHVVTEAP